MTDLRFESVTCESRNCSSSCYAIGDWAEPIICSSSPPRFHPSGSAEGSLGAQQIVWITWGTAGLQLVIIGLLLMSWRRPVERPVPRELGFCEQCHRPMIMAPFVAGHRLAHRPPSTVYSVVPLDTEL